MKKFAPAISVRDVTIMFQGVSSMKGSLSASAYVVAALVTASYAFVTLRGPGGLHAITEKRAEIRELEKRNAALAQEIERKRDHIHRLTDNPAEQELEIRNRLKLVKPNEKVYIIGAPPKN
jgi:cell division protein FtsB